MVLSSQLLKVQKHLLHCLCFFGCCLMLVVIGYFCGLSSFLCSGSLFTRYPGWWGFELVW